MLQFWWKPCCWRPGGAVGLGLGAALSVLSIVLAVKLPVTMTYVVLALVVSTFAGVVSGWYPASRAARMTRSLH
jgi:putative ABC transport system permease protein